MPELILKTRDYLALTCINSEIETVCNDIKDLLSKYKYKLKIIETLPESSSIELPDQPYNAKQGFLLWTPIERPGGCAFMATNSDGWSTLMYNMGTIYRHECLKMRISSPSVMYPICELAYYRNGAKIMLQKSSRRKESDSKR